jgi:molybdate transport system permease protein
MFKRTAIVFAFSILVLYGIIIVSVFYFFDATTFAESMTSTRVMHAITTSLYAATLATLLATLIAIPGAYALSRFSFPLKSWIDILLEFPVGIFIQNNVMDFVFVFSGIVLAQFVTVAGISTRLMKAVYDEVPARYEQVARTLGASHGKAFFSITMPLAKNGIVSSVILTWAKAVGEFGATITLAGAMAMKTETLPVAIYMQLSMADIEGTVILILILFSISISLLILTRVVLLRK